MDSNRTSGVRFRPCLSGSTRGPSNGQEHEGARVGWHHPDTEGRDTACALPRKPLYGFMAAITLFQPIGSPESPFLLMT